MERAAPASTERLSNALLPSAVPRDTRGGYHPAWGARPPLPFPEAERQASVRKGAGGRAGRPTGQVEWERGKGAGNPFDEPRMTSGGR